MVQTSHEEGSRFVDNNCKAHLMVDEVHPPENGSFKIKCSVLAGTDPGQVGKSLTDFIKYEGKAAAMALNLAEATGLVTREQRRQAHDQGVGISFDETLLKGRQFCATITMERAQRKNSVTGQYEDDPEKPYPFARIGFNTYSVWDAKASGIPKDQQFLALCQKPAGGNGTAATPAPAQQSPAPLPAQQSLPMTGPAQSAVSMNW